MPQVAVDGVLFEYADQGTGAPVVFIDGALVAGTFRPLAAHARLKLYRRITYTRRGYGGSGATSDVPDIARQAADCSGLLRALDVDAAHIVGHSFGGAVALQLARDVPGIVRSLALIEPALMLGETGDAYRASLEGAIRRYREAGPAEVIDAFLAARWPGYREPLEAALPGALQQAIVDAPATFDLDLPGLLDWDFDEDDLAEVTQPVLSILGGESEALWARFGEVHRLLLARLPNARGHVIPRATHFMHLQNLDDMANALGDFLEVS